MYNICDVGDAMKTLSCNGNADSCVASKCSGDDDVEDDEMSSLVLYCIDTIAKGGRATGSLYQRYLDQFMSWKLCCRFDSVAALWFQDQVGKSSKSSNIIQIHLSLQ